MPSDYTGNSGSVQSPATAPAVNNPPVLALPVDSDPRNSGSIYQPFKVLADNITLILKMLGGTLTAKLMQIDGTGGNAPPIAGATFAVSSGMSLFNAISIVVTPVSSNATITQTSSCGFAIDSSGGAVTVTLPLASSLAVNPIYIFKDVGNSAATNNITVATQGGDTIDGAASKVINTNYGSMRMMRTGLNTWGVI